MNRQGCVITVALTWYAAVGLAQDSKETRRARLPTFDKRDVRQYFFDDVFSQLHGARPQRLNTRPALPSLVEGAAASAPTTRGWSKIISATTIADEVKALKINVDKHITTPTAFATRGHLPVRRDFAVLAMLFGIVAEYDAEVRFRPSAVTARNRFARSAATIEAGGNANVFQEARRRKHDLQDLLSGSTLTADGATEEADWETGTDRSILMQRLETSHQDRLAAWTSSAASFADNRSRVTHEAELTAAIAEVLTLDGMPDEEDDDYAQLAAQLKSAALQIVSAVRLGSYDQARHATGELSKACAQCHELYR